MGGGDGQMKKPWTYDYDNDTGPDDDGFWEWWSIHDADGNLMAKAESKEIAEVIIAAVNAG